MTSRRAKPLTAAERLKASIVAVATEGLAAYYERFPERLGDVRGKDAHDYSMAGVGMVLAEIDKFRISDKGSKSEDAKLRRGVYAQALAIIQGRAEDYLAAEAEALTPAQQAQVLEHGLQTAKQILAVLDGYELLRIDPKS